MGNRQEIEHYFNKTVFQKPFTKLEINDILDNWFLM